MRRHIVVAFVIMFVVSRPFGHEAVEMAFQVLPDGRVGIFIDSQGCRSMLDEQMQQAALNRVNDWQRDEDFIGNQMKTACFNGQQNLLLNPHAIFLFNNLRRSGRLFRFSLIHFPATKKLTKTG